ncbi:MAG: F0F1 ATP synthase subunit B family protein [Syntrophales bacterium]
MVSIDYSLGIQILNFLILIFILNILLYKPILGVLDKRKKQTADSEAEVGKLQGSIDQKMFAYEEKLRLAKAEALAMKKTLIKQGDEAAKALIDATRSEIPGLQEAFRLRTAGEIAAAKNILADNSRKLSVEIAEKIMGRGL